VPENNKENIKKGRKIFKTVRELNLLGIMCERQD
jgi:hypothetical protein